jgi:CRP-like cAMP-binding protein
MSESAEQSTQNFILSNLPKVEYERILPHLEPVKLSLGDFIYHSEQAIEYVYFPSSGMISITSCTAEGHSVEIGAVGKEGMAGIDVLMNVDFSLNESIVQIPGDGFRMKKEFVRKEFKKGGAFQDLLMRYLHTFLVQASRGTVCNAIHTIEKRFAKWLLESRDRVESDQLDLTQEFIATMLGANRPSVSVVANALQAAGLIKYRRGKITILDSQGLEDTACECYEIVKREYELYRNGDRAAGE